MNVHRISAMALAMTMTGFAGTGDTAVEGAAPAALTTPQKDDFTPMTRSERVGAYVNGTFGPTSVAKSAAHAGLGFDPGHREDAGIAGGSCPASSPAGDSFAPLAGSAVGR